MGKSSLSGMIRHRITGAFFRGARPRLATIVMAAFVGFTIAQFAGFADVAFAQDDAAAPAVAAPEPAPAAAAPAGGDAAAPVVQESFLSLMIRASGVYGLILLILSVIMVAIIMMNVFGTRRSDLLPDEFVEAFEARLNEKDYNGAYEIAKSDDSFIARVLTAGMSRLNRGYEEAVEGMQDVGEEEALGLEQRLSYLALIGSIGPMVGLMGTVSGMISSFRVIASSETAPKPKELADGISAALFTTLEGLAVAIPAMVAYTLLRNRVQGLVLEVGNVSENLMSRFAASGKKPGAAAPAKPTT